MTRDLVATKVCPNHCIFGSYGGASSYGSMKTYMEDRWNFCPVCSAPALVFKRPWGVYSNLAPDNPDYLAYEKEGRRRFLHWKKARRGFNWQMDCTLPPVPEKPKPVKKRKKTPEVAVVEANVRPRRTRATQVVAAPPPQEVARSLSAARHVVSVEINPGRSPMRRSEGLVVAAVGESLTKALLVTLLKQRFERLNPYVGTDLVDWHSCVPSHSTFDEGLDAVSREYPHFVW